jgi:hypothetical protein
MRRPVVASAILATLLMVPLGMAAAAPIPSVAVTDSARATAALEYLVAAQKSDGSIDASLGETADLVIGAAAAGYDPATLTGCAGISSALDFLATGSDGATADAGATGKAILAVVSAGGDPSSFSGRDLTARLAALYDSGTGAYGDGSTISQSYAILAIVASEGAVPTLATDELISLQGPADGSWSYGSAQESAGDGDSNDTAVALMALEESGVHTVATDAAEAAALTYFATQQVDDGGFAYSTAWGATSDADSDAEVIQALIAAGQDPLSAGWSRGSGNALTAMRAAQGTDGGFAYLTYGESAFTTREIPAALMGVPYAAAVRFTPGKSVPTSSCAAGSSPSATASASASASASPSPTQTPTPTPTPRPTAAPTSGPITVPASAPTTSGAAPATVAATETPAYTATDAAALVAGETAAPSAAPAGPVAPAGSTGSGSSGGIPAPLAYALAALAALGAVSVGGWLLLLRPVKP